MGVCHRVWITPLELAHFIYFKETSIRFTVFMERPNIGPLVKRFQADVFD